MMRIPLDQATPGMVLAKPVTNPTGLPILPAGTELDADLIRRLDKLNQYAVYVEGGAAVENHQTLAELEEALNQRFQKVADDPTQVMIREAVRRLLHASRADATMTGDPT